MDPDTLIIFDRRTDTPIAIGELVVTLGSPGVTKTLRLDPTPLNPKGAVRFGNLPEWQQQQIKAAIAKPDALATES